eukprot:TRINITY_DN4390_c0_g1_i2.p1 TRINITY_DN4390_c0_g1~~TRINITY_DN4390_c0_g1_i2.p1  ORF type:complete len:417 (+),score=34.77 TRINITY_DN4390_c0_g1_i2:28-1278(+)
MSKQELVVPTFEDLGLLPILCDTCKEIGYKHPTKIQLECIPHALQGRDVLGLAETGSGKTAAFSLPLLQDLAQNLSPIHSLIISPTRELATQIAQNIKALGSKIKGLKICLVIGGANKNNSTMQQSIELTLKPHIVVGTPGRLNYHIQNTKGFSFRTLKYLVLDEADMLLQEAFGDEINLILKALPSNRNTYLFSATLTDKVQKLQRMSLRNPIRLHVDKKFQTVQTLKQHYVFMQDKFKESYLVYLLNDLPTKYIMVFVSTRNMCEVLNLILEHFGFDSKQMHGQMLQAVRSKVFASFQQKKFKILVSTNVASRGLDISHVDVVINYEIPDTSKDYVHRVGRTARAGAAGVSISFVTQYDVEAIQKIEESTGEKMEEYKTNETLALSLYDRVSEAKRLACVKMSERDKKNKEKHR